MTRTNILYGHHLIHTLREHGYHCALCGIQHIANMFPDPPKTIGYDEFLGCDIANGHAKAIEFLRRRHDRPFFLSMGFFETHRPFPSAHPHDAPRYCQPPAPLPDTPATRNAGWSRPAIPCRPATYRCRLPPGSTTATAHTPKMRACPMASADSSSITA